MPRTLHLNRDTYGNLTEATFDKPSSEHFDELTGKRLDVKRFEKRRRITSYKDLVWAFCRAPTRKELFNAAWRRATQYGYSLSGAKLSELHEYFEEAKIDAEAIENVIGELVNDERSRFYIHG